MRGIRELKKEREALRAMEMDTKEIDYKIRRRTEAYNDFSKAAKVKEKTEMEVIETMKLVFKAGGLACLILIVAIGLVILVSCLISVIKSIRGK